MAVDVIAMIERMAEYGTAPHDGCALFGVGYDEAFARLRSKYFEARFARGDSAEKFVVGPFGSGKTHFLRQLMEIARALECVTAEVTLNKDLDFTKSLIVYREVVRAMRAGLPGTPRAAITWSPVGSPGSTRPTSSWRRSGGCCVMVSKPSCARMTRRSLRLAAGSMARSPTARWRGSWG